MAAAQPEVTRAGETSAQEALVKESQARAFELRARFLTRTARLVLFTIYLLVAGAAAAFVFARAIADLDFGPSVDDKLREVKGELDPLLQQSRDFDNELKQLAPAILAYRTELRKILATLQPPVPGRASLGPFSFQFPLNTDQVYTVAGIADYIQSCADHSAQDRRDPFAVIIPLGKLDPLTLTLDQAHVPQFLSSLRSQSVATQLPVESLQKMIGEQSDRQERIQQLQSAVDKLKDIQLKTLVETRQSASHRDRDDDAGWLWAHVLQTNITRFGTLLIITIIVTILVPLYRYNVRLSAYYQARGDALRLIGTDLRLGFAELTSVLTPRLDFGKPPRAPTEQIADLLRAASEAVAKKETTG